MCSLGWYRLLLKKFLISDCFLRVRCVWAVHPRAQSGYLPVTVPSQPYPLSLTCWLTLLPQMHSPHYQPRYSQSIWPARWCQSIPSRSVSAQKQPQEQPLKKKVPLWGISEHHSSLSDRIPLPLTLSLQPALTIPSASLQGPAFNLPKLLRVVQNNKGPEGSRREREITVSSCGWVCYKAGRKPGFEFCSASMLHTEFLYSCLAHPGQKHMAMWWSAVSPTLYTGIVLLC